MRRHRRVRSDRRRWPPRENRSLPKYRQRRTLRRTPRCRSRQRPTRMYRSSPLRVDETSSEQSCATTFAVEFGVPDLSVAQTRPRPNRLNKDVIQACQNPVVVLTGLVWHGERGSRDDWLQVAHRADRSAARRAHGGWKWKWLWLAPGRGAVNPPTYVRSQRNWVYDYGSSGKGRKNPQFH